MQRFYNPICRMTGNRAICGADMKKRIVCIMTCVCEGHVYSLDLSSPDLPSVPRSPGRRTRTA